MPSASQVWPGNPTFGWIKTIFILPRLGPFLRFIVLIPVDEDGQSLFERVPGRPSQELSGPGIVRQQPVYLAGPWLDEDRLDAPALAAKVDNQIGQVDN